MNFSAFEYWTDGWDDGILMSRDYGIRLCTCGRFVLRREMTDVSTSDESDAPRMDYVDPNQIDACIATADSPEMEIAARRYRWHQLNHSYREQYRTIAMQRRPPCDRPGKQGTPTAAPFGNVSRVGKRRSICALKQQ